MTQDLSILLSFAISPQGNLYLYSDGEERVSKQIADKIYNLFSSGSEIGLLRFGISHFDVTLPPSFAFWQQFARLFITESCKLSGFETIANNEFKKLSLSPPVSEFADLLQNLPFMYGAEYINSEMLSTIWQNLGKALIEELKEFNGKLQEYFGSFNATWNKIGRVCFHLAENKLDQNYPFAFLATYTTKVTSSANVQHLPLSQALKEYSGKQKRSQLLSLLLPIQKSTEKSTFIKHLVDEGLIFQPQAWESKDAYQFLQAIPVIEESGVVVRVPNWWNPKKPPRPQVTVAVGNITTHATGLDALLDFNMHFALPDGSDITLEELENLINTQGRLVQIKGQWVEINADKLKQVLSYWKKVEHQVIKEGLSFREGLRLLAGSSKQDNEEIEATTVGEWSKVLEGKWLKDVLSRLRYPERQGDPQLIAVLQNYLNASLRPYQQSGVYWLWWLYNLNLGGCLADDMGLGKTIQVLALLLVVKHYNNSNHSNKLQKHDVLIKESKELSNKKTHLLILPASLLGNWQAEISKFAPSLNILIAHSSVSRKDSSKQIKDLPDLSNTDLVITTYAYVHRLSWLKDVSWDILIVDEAQNIKNPAAKQTNVIKQLISRIRFALTGTPIENRLLDLWSLFDFIAQGLLGTSKTFSDYGKKAVERKKDVEEPLNTCGVSGEQQFYSTVRNLVSPYILRRLKSDKQIISDLPDKTEIEAYCYLTKQQIALYQQSIDDLKRRLDQGLDNGERVGLVLSYLTRFKQICNHPSQWLGHGQYDEQASGKFIRLRELCEVIAAKQEKVLIFTQYREIMQPLSEFVASIFKKPGLMLHGQTVISERAKLVSSFQNEDGPPFFILSLKAGGIGLNLTNAAHVIHFDRWWNPAVENQATDRAYRIGQKKNVLVHKFICQGTIEEKIDFLIKSKQDLSNELLTSSNSAKAITNLSDRELLEVVTLDIHRALGGS